MIFDKAHPIIRRISYSYLFFAIFFLFLLSLTFFLFIRNIADDFESTSISIIRNESKKLNQLYLEQLLNEFAARMDIKFDQIESDLISLSNFAKTILDNKNQLRQVNRYLLQTDFQEDRYDLLKYPNIFPKERKPSVLTWLDFSSRSKSELIAFENSILETSLLNVVFPSYFKYGAGAKKTQIDFAGSPEFPYFREYGLTVSSRAYDKNYFGFSKSNYWDSFSPKLLAKWRELRKKNLSQGKDSHLITVTPPLISLEGNLRTIMVEPIWYENTSTLQGAIFINYDLLKIKGIIEDLSTAQNAIVFLADSKDKQILLASTKGINKLGLKESEATYPTINRRVLSYSLQESPYSEIRDLNFPLDRKIINTNIKIGEEEYIYLAKNITPRINFYKNELSQRPWTIGILIKEKQVYSTYYQAKEKLKTTQNQLVYLQLLILLVTLSLAVFIAFTLRRKLKGKLTMISNRFSSPDAKRSVENLVQEKDEFSYISRAFSWLYEKINSQDQEINKLKDSYQSSLISLEQLFKIYVRENRFLFNQYNDQSDGSLLKPFYEYLLELNSIQEKIASLKIEDSQIQEIHKAKSPKYDEKLNSKTPHEVNLADQFSRIFVVGYEPSEFKNIKAFLELSYSKEPIVPFTKEYPFTRTDKKIIFVVNPNIERSEEKNFGAFLESFRFEYSIAYLDSSNSSITDLVDAPYKELFGQRLQIFHSKLLIENAETESSINFIFRRLSEYLSRILEEEKIEPVLEESRKLLLEIYPELKIFIFQAEKMLFPQETPNEETLNRIESVKKEFQTAEDAERKKIYFELEGYSIFAGNFELSKNIFFMIESENTFQSHQRQLFEVALNSIQFKLSNSNLLQKDPKLVSILKKILVELEDIEMIKAARQYSTIQYINNKREPYIERVPISFLVNFLKDHFIHPHRSYLINPMRVRKVIQKNSRYALLVGEEEITISKHSVEEFKKVFPYWFQFEF